jgi:hypothetical protein
MFISEIIHYFFKSAKNRGKGGVQTDTTFETSEEHFKSSEREVFIIIVIVLYFIFYKLLLWAALTV